VLPEWLRFTGGLYLIIFAGIVIALLIACPQGIMGLLERGWAAVQRLSKKSAVRGSTP
jgi:branched-chain amino acid transport system permease protein